MRASGADCGSRGIYPPAAALIWEARLEAASAGHAQDMAARDYFSHTSPEGLSPGDRIAAQGYAARAWAENIAAGQRSVSAVVAAWADSDGHCANLMHASLQQMALACVRSDTARYATYWVLKLATPR